MRGGAGGAAALLAAAAVGLTGACANQSPPPGGPEDRRPPVVVGTEPDTFGTIADAGTSVRFLFDERISETTSDGDLSAAVTVSPLTGEVSVDHGRSSLSVSIEGGFRPDLVYRVTLLPVVSDLFGNRMTEAFEVVFSTGAEPEETATLAGEVWDRVSGRGLNGATVRAVGRDSLVHLARADQQGIFALRYLPVGEFVLTGFEDGDRDREVGPRETRGSTAASVAVGDTLLVDIAVLAPDTTPAGPLRATALDSVTVVVEFDDYLDPGAPSEAIEVQLSRESGPSPVVTRLYHEFEYVEYVSEVGDSLARLDSIDAAQAALEAAAAAATDTAAGTSTDTATSDTATAVPGDTAVVSADSVATPPDDAATPDSAGAGAPVDTAVAAGLGVGIPGTATTPPARRGPPSLSGAARTPASGPPGRILPGRRLVGRLDGPLQEDEYVLQVGPVVNLNGLSGEPGETTLVYEAPEPPADSVPVTPADSVAAADSVAPDGAAPPADTLGLLR